MLDLIIRNANLPDGRTGIDIGIADGFIADVTPGLDAKAHREIDASGRLATPPSDALLWGGGRRMPELCGAVASVQLKKLPKILRQMRGSKHRIKAMLKDAPGISFRRSNDADGDTGPFLILILDSARRATAAVERMQAAGLHSAFRIADYGLHIYSNIPALVKKTPTSADCHSRSTRTAKLAPAPPLAPGS